MLTVKNIVLVLFLGLLSANVVADTVSVTDSTLDGAEAKVAQLAAKENASYQIISASYKNRMYMTAKLNK